MTGCLYVTMNQRGSPNWQGCIHLCYLPFAQTREPFMTFGSIWSFTGQAGSEI